ncbi:GNAT family N-acetyltransferase (plasmid) [Haloferacaceae archaeon DSL9]
MDAEVTGVYVHPSVARQGVGTRIYTELERRARTHDVQTVGLSASRNAVAFYEAHGYERVREYTHAFSSHESTGVTGTVVEMKKKL